MKREYKEKLDKMYWFFNNYKNMPYEEYSKKCIEYFNVPLDELIETKDQEVLENLLNFFNEDFEDYFECICESLMCQIDVNYTPDQLLNVFYKKFDGFAKNDPWRCHVMSLKFFHDEYFDEFRKMFNLVKSKSSELFLEEFNNEYDRELSPQVKILREDMKKW